MYVAGGLVPFLHWTDLPMPGPEAGQFLAALVDSDLLKVSKTLEVVFGIALRFNLWVPLALAVLAPVLFFIGWAQSRHPHLYALPARARSSRARSVSSTGVT